jgi:hypothetical protein
MKQFCFLLLMIAAGVLALPDSMSAQDQSAAHIFVTTVQKTVRVEGGRVAERDSLLSLYHEHVTKKNPHIISQRALQHLYGADNRDMVWVTEYKDWASVEAAVKMDDELFEKRWSDEASRRKFNQMLNKYFGQHADEMYSEKTALRK